MGTTTLTLGRNATMSKATAAAINLRAFKDNGTVSEAEYEDVSKRLLPKIQGMRVPAIRKGLVFEPQTYDAYVTEAEDNYDRQFAPIRDPELGIELNVLIFTFQTKVSMTMFPDFTREYFQVMQMDRISLADFVIEVSQQGYCVAPTQQFRSLLLAAHQIEQEVKKRYEQSTLTKDVSPKCEVETRFFVPLNEDLNDTEPMLIQVQIQLFPDDLDDN